MGLVPLRFSSLLLPPPLIYLPLSQPGHVASLDIPVSEIKSKLSQVRGRIVPMPLNFLKDAKVFETDASVNPVTMAIYL